MEAGILLGAEFAAGKYDHRHFGERFVGSQRFQHFKAGHVGQTQIEYHAVGGLPAQGVECVTSGAGGFDLHVVVAEQLGYAHLLGRVVFDDQQAFAPRCRIILDAGKRGFNAFHGCRFCHEGKCAACQSVKLVLVEGYDLDRDMARQRVLLELAQHAPAQHVGEKHVERYGGWLILLGKFECVGAARRHQNLKAATAREIDQDTTIVRVILDDQQDGIARLDLVPVVRDLFDWPLGQHNR